MIVFEMPYGINNWDMERKTELFHAYVPYALGRTTRIFFNEDNIYARFLSCLSMELCEFNLDRWYKNIRLSTQL